MRRAGSAPCTHATHILLTHWALGYEHSKRWAAVAPSVDVDVGAAFRKLTLEVIAEATFGLSANDAGILPK